MVKVGQVEPKLSAGKSLGPDIDAVDGVVDPPFGVVDDKPEKVQSDGMHAMGLEGTLLQVAVLDVNEQDSTDLSRVGCNIFYRQKRVSSLLEDHAGEHWRANRSLAVDGGGKPSVS